MTETIYPLIRMSCRAGYVPFLIGPSDWPNGALGMGAPSTDDQQFELTCRSIGNRIARVRERVFDFIDEGGRALPE
jgi:hypothetical protein